MLKLGRHPLAVAYMVMALTVGFVLTWTHHIDQRSISGQKSEISTSRVASCNQSNTQQTDQAKAEKAEIRILIAALAQGTTDPSISDRIKTFYKDYDAQVDSAHPQRDCTTAGIAKFLNLNPGN